MVEFYSSLHFLHFLVAGVHIRPLRFFLMVFVDEEFDVKRSVFTRDKKFEDT